MNIPSNLKYTKDHEWARVEGAFAVVGISDFAQDQLGDIVFVELPKIGKKVKAGETAAVVESTKTASDVFAPLSGEVVEINKAVSDDGDPGNVNSDPYGKGWLFKLRLENPAETSALISPKDYETLVSGLESSH